MSKKIRELQARKAALVAEGRAIADKPDMSAEDQSAFDAIKAKIDGVNAAIDREQMLVAEEARIGVPVREEAVIQVSENRANDPRHGFARFSDFAAAVRRASEPGAAIDQRLMIGAAAPSTVGSEGVGADGGFAIPPQYSTDIFRLVLGEDSLLPLTDNTEVSSNSMVFPKTEQTPWGSTGVRAYWQAEATAATATKPVLGTQTLRLHKLMALVPLTDELVADSNALESLLPNLIGDSIRWKVNEAILNGTGSGQPQGVTVATAAVVQAKDSGQAASTLTATNVANMVSRLPPGSFSRAVWLINPAVLPALFTMTLGNYPIYMPGGAQVGGIQPSPYGMLLGRPIMVSQHAAAFSSQGDVQLHDFSYYRTITKAGGVQTASSMHLYFDADAVAFRALFRVDGASKIAAAISPAKGSTTLSPFVVLQNR